MVNSSVEQQFSKPPLVGIVGWRGMVGSVLMERMLAEHDFDLIDPVFFSTSNAGAPVPLFSGQKVTKKVATLQDAKDLDALRRCDIILTCQGAITPKQFFLNCARVAGMVIGLTRPVPYVCRMMSCWF